MSGSEFVSAFAGRRSRDRRWALAVAVLFVAICMAYFRARSSADLLALWEAGRSLAAGRPDQVYPPDSTYFTMLPPVEWLSRLSAEGYQGDSFPYLYPPLWAWLMSLVVRRISYDTVQMVASLANPLLLVGLLLAGRRLAAPTMSVALFLATGAVVLLLSSVGSVALYQNQPQILVAFLCVLAVERAEAGHEREAGAVLALAAALKIYPVFYAVLWLAGGQRRAALSFALSGAALAALSVAAVGWPLHLRFLTLLRVISDTAMMSHITYAWESVIGGLMYPDQLQPIFSAEIRSQAAATGSWRVLAKPAGFSLMFKGVQVAALGGLAVAFRRTRTSGERALLWPFAFAVLSLAGPMAWSYHYLAVAAFAPCLVQRLGMARGVAVLTLVVLLTSPWIAAVFVPATGPTPELSRNLQAIGTVTMTGLALALLAVRRRRPAPAMSLPGSPRP